MKKTHLPLISFTCSLLVIGTVWWFQTIPETTFQEGYTSLREQEGEPSQKHPTLLTHREEEDVSRHVSPNTEAPSQHVPEQQQVAERVSAPDVEAKQTATQSEEPTDTEPDTQKLSADAPSTSEPPSYVQHLSAEAQPLFVRWSERYPEVDFTDNEDVHTAENALRGQYPAQLDAESRKAFVSELMELESLHEQMVAARAAEEGLELSGKDAQGTAYTIIGFLPSGPPLLSQPENDDAAISSAASYVRQQSSFDSVFGPDIDGSGFQVNVNDHGTIYLHAEFAARTTVMETYDSGNRSHMTHVAGTIGAQGLVASAKGMAPAVEMLSFIQQSTSDIYNYGMTYPGEAGKSIVGNTSLGTAVSAGEGGAYSTADVNFDNANLASPYYLHFYSAGNSGSGWDTLSKSYKESKNMVTVANVTDATRDANGTFTGGAVIVSSSSRGPADDGRIKPDLSGNGYQLYSPDSLTGYGNKTGTSMASPNAAGTAVLLQDYFHKRFPGHYMRAATLKTLLIHGADDIGNVGPDYTYGWGLINALTSGNLIKAYADNPANRRMVEADLAQGETDTYTFTYTGSGPIRATLGWWDPAGAAGTSSGSANDRTPDITNDLNVKVISPSGTEYFPWVMPFVTNGFNTSDHGTPATTGVNTTDTIEMVLLNAPGETGVWTVEVSHVGTLSNGPQQYSLMLDGPDGSDALPSPVLSSVSPDNGDTDGLELTLSGSGFLLGADVTLRRQGSSDIDATAEEVLPGNIVCRVDLASADIGFWDVVVRNPNGVEVVLANGFLVPAPGNPSPQPPVFTSTSGGDVIAGDSYSYSITTTDADTAGSSLTFSAPSIPGWLGLVDNGNGTATLSGIPGNGDAGEVEITLAVTDGSYTTYQVFDLQVYSDTPPVVSTPPASQTIDYGTNATFSVVAGEGPPPYTYQWRKDGINIGGATSSSYTVVTATDADEATYSVVVTNSRGSVTSSGAVLTVNPPTAVSITSHPMGQNKVISENVTFTVTASGSEPITYQWKKDGVDIPGATSSSYTMTGLSLSDAGVYSVVVDNDANSPVSSNGATLTMSSIAYLLADDFSDNDRTTNPAWYKINGNNLVESGGVISFSESGNNSYMNAHWGGTTLMNTGDALEFNFRMKYDDTGSSLDGLTKEFTFGVGYSNGSQMTADGTGNTVDDVGYIASLGGSSGQSAIRKDVGGHRWLGSNTDVSDVGSTESGPVAGETYKDFTLTLTLNASSGLDISLSDGTNTINRTDASPVTTTFDQVTFGHYGRNLSNSLDVDSISVTYIPAASPEAPSIITQPSSTSVTEGGNASFTVVATGNPTPTYQWKKNGSDISGATNATYSITGVATGDAGDYTVVVTNSEGSVTSSAATLTVTPPLTAPVITSHPSSASVVEGGNTSFTVVATGNPTPTYQWKKDGVDINGATSATYSITGAANGDAGDYTVVVTNSEGSVTSNAATLTVTGAPEAPAITSQPSSTTVLEGGNASFTVVATGTPTPSYQWKKDGVDINGATSATYSITGVATGDAGDYTVVITNSEGSVTSSAATLTVNLAPPSITSQPSGQTLDYGANASFSVSVTGSAPFTYQWRKDGVNIGGANASSYDITGVTTTDAATYTVVITNGAGSVTSNDAVLTVNPPVAPTITTHPASQSKLVGENVTLSVTATGTAPLTYQWKKDGVDISGATSDTYSITGVAVGDAGNYTVVVDNAASSPATSNIAVLTVSTVATVFEDLFTDNDRTVNPTWVTVTGGNLVETGGVLSFTASGNNNYLNGNWGGTTLANEGDVLTFSFRMKYDDSGANLDTRTKEFNFSIGSSENAGYTDDIGYVASLGGSSAQSAIRKDSGGDRYLGSNSDVSDLGATATAPVAAETFKDFTLTLTRNASNGLDISLSDGTDTINRTDASPVTTTFDQVTIGYYGRNLANFMDVDSVSVTFTPAPVLTDIQQYFVDSGLSANTPPGDDSDGDGMSNQQEFEAGTDPNDNSSRLIITNLTVTSAGIVTVEWNSNQTGNAPARQYRVMYSDGPLSGSSVWTELQGSIDAAGSTTTLQDNLSDDAVEQRNYRIEIEGSPQAKSTNVRSSRVYELAENKAHYISFPVSPGTATLNGLLGNSLPTGTSEANSTVVDLWDQDTQSMSARYWHSDTPAWIRSSDSGNGGNDSLDLSKGVKLILRDGVGTQKLYIAGTIHTSSTTIQQTVQNNGTTFAAPPIVENIPFNAGGGGDGTGLVTSGFTGHTNSPNSDWVYLLNPVTGNYDILVWFYTGDNTWRDINGNVATVNLEPGKPVLIRRKNRAGNFTWSLTPDYTP